ncbi:hypothetical protein EV360DRAFT_57705, partial [Lentinula raphanica]
LQSGALAARSDDIVSVKFTVAQCLNFRGPGLCPVPLLQPDDRTGRGFTNDLTGKLLTLIQIDWEESSEAICMKNLDTSNSYFIRAFYEGEEGDPNDVEHGFLRSALLLQVCHSAALELNTSTSSNTTTPFKKARKSTRKNVAQRLDMKEVSPRSIAYACIMLRFSLSDASAWNSDQSFNYQGLYNTIIDYLDDLGSNSDDNIRELLDWWTKCVKLNVPASSQSTNLCHASVRNVFAKLDASTSVQPIRNFNNTIQKQRSAKRAAAKHAKRAGTNSTIVGPA